MDDGQQDQYEERLKEVFESFDASGAGSLCPEELSDLCQALHLEDSTPTLLHALLQNQDRLTGRVDFDQFKNALVLVLSTSIAAAPSQETTCALLSPDSPVQAKFVRGSKRYGRHSTPEFIETVTDFSAAVSSDAIGQDPEDHEDSTVPRKRERWNTHESRTEEYEAEGQLHLWNPDEPSTPRGSTTPLSDHLEDRLRQACEELAMPWDGCASHHELLALCDHLELEVTEDVLQVLSVNEIMSVQVFASWVLNHTKPPTPSASTPYRQLKRLHSSQPFDETGRRTSAMTSTIGMRLFSTLDDGTGSAPAEYVLDAWMEEGIENSSEILQALDFDLEAKVNLSELTVALENELLMTKNGIHQAALASFKAEIRYLLERVDRELREKEKIRSDLEKAEKLKTQLATEVDEHHSAIERMNDLNLRKQEQEHREKLVSVRSELIKEMDQIQQQAGLQREELEAEMEKIRDDETFLRDHLSLTVKESRRLEMELLDSTEKLVEAENQVRKLQRNLDSILKEKFGDLDPGSAEFFLQEERLRLLRSSYEEQCRELQDRIDELQAELQEYHNLGRTSQLCLKPSLSEDLESKSLGMESDPGLGSEEGQPLFNMSLEAEMMLEQLKEKHLREMEDLQAQLESKVSELDQKVEAQKADLEAQKADLEAQKADTESQKADLALQYLEEIQALRGEMSSIQNRALELQAQLENAEEERASLEQRQAGVKEELEHQQEEEVSSLRQELLEAHIQASDLEEQLKVLEAQQAKAELGLDTEKQELRKLHALELNKLDEQHEKILQVRLEEERRKLQEERVEVERRLLEEWEKEKVEVQQSHEAAVKARIEEVSLKFQAEREELEMRLTEEWEREKAQLDEQSNESLQTVLEDEMLRLVKEQEGREIRLTEQWKLERVQLQECQEEALLTRSVEEKLKQQEQQEQQEEAERRLREDWDRERLQLEEDYERMLQERLQEDRERLAREKEEVEKRLEQMIEEEKERLEEAHRQAVQELSAKHSEEREQLSGLLDKLREDIAEERKELESHFSQKIREVEARFSGDQDAVTERFQTDVSNLEKHYQSELRALTQSHADQKTKWDAETEEVLQEAEEQRRVLQETMELEQETITQDLVKERELLDSVHKKEMDALVAKNQELQKELESFISLAQTKEIELSRQLNDLHNRLQENLDTKDKLLAQSEKRAQEIELLLNQAVEDFKQERAELQGSFSELEARHTLAEKQLEERCELLSERNHLKLKIEELEKLLRQAAVDFQFERLELQENISDLELKLKESRPSSDLQDNEKGELLAERDQLSIRIQEIENELNQLLESADITEDKEMEESNEVDLPPLVEEHLEAATLEEQEVCSENITVSDETCDNVVPVDCEGLEVEYVAPVEQGPNYEIEIITESPHEMESSENIIAEVCDQEITVTSDNLNVLVEASETCGEQGQDDVVEMIPETPNRLEECPEDTITLHLDGECYDETTVDDGQDPVVESVAVEEQAQDGDTCEGGMTAETSEDIEVCPENIISVEACNGEVAAIPEECQDLVEESQSPEYQGQAEDNMDEDTNNDIVALPIPEEQPQSDDIDGDVCPFEMKCEDSSPDKMEQNVASVEETGFDDKSYVSLVVSSALEEMGHDSDDTKVACSFEENQDLEKDAVELISQLQQKYEEAVKEKDVCEIMEIQEQVIQFQSEASCLALLQSQYDSAAEENLTLQQKMDALESLSAENGVNTASDQQALEENGTLKAQAKEIKVMSLDMTALQIRYEECICENAKLEEQNCGLEKRVLGLESKMHIIQDFQDQQVALVDEITRMREENCKLTDLVSELERQDEILMALQLEAESEEDATTEQEQESFLDLNSQLEAKIQAVSELEDCCTEFEKQNAKLRRALTDLQDKSLRIHERMQTHRNEACRLAEENLVLRHKISTLKEEDLREAQEETLLKLEHFRKEKIAAQKKAESFKRQISELRLRSQQLEDENGLLSEQNAQNAAGVEGLSQQLGELLRQSERPEAVRDQRHTVPEDDRTKMAVCVSGLEAELTNAVEGTVLHEQDMAQLVLQLNTPRDKVAKMGAMECQLSLLLQEHKALEKQTQGLRNQLAKSQERTHVLEESLQSANLQSARLKSDFRVSQQEKDALKQEVMSLHKQLQNANDKNQVLEMALHSSGYQSQHKKLYRDELARLVGQEQELLRQENERLTVDLHHTKADLHHTRDKTRQLEAAILTVKQQKLHGQSSVVKTVEQEKTALKRELDMMHQELLSAQNKVCEVQRELESLRQENEDLKTQQTQLQARLLEALQVQLGGLLPTSPRRMPGERREQHRGDDLNPENIQDERAMMMMMKMEERMREIELSLHNVKLLLKEKVCQLKDQLHKNGKADSMIKDLYVENAQLLKALQMTEQRQKVAEKKNFLLEEKISSLNKIVRDLSPSPLTPVLYHFTCS